MFPSHFKPKAPADFIGHAGLIATQLDTWLAASIPEGAPGKFLFLGKPGVGKSALADYVMARLKSDRWHTILLNGKQVGIDQLEDIARSLHYKELFGTYRVIRFEEVDALSHAAQVRALTLCDELPPYTAVIGTSNCKVEDLEERFHSRFLCFIVKPPPADAIETLLRKLAPTLPASTVRQIATFACGNVRLALLEADTALIGQPQPLAA